MELAIRRHPKNPLFVSLKTTLALAGQAGLTVPEYLKLPAHATEAGRGMLHVFQMKEVGDASCCLIAFRALTGPLTTALVASVYVGRVVSSDEVRICTPAWQPRTTELRRWLQRIPVHEFEGNDANGDAQIMHHKSSHPVQQPPGCSRQPEPRRRPHAAESLGQQWCESPRRRRLRGPVLVRPDGQPCWKPRRRRVRPRSCSTRRSGSGRCGLVSQRSKGPRCCRHVWARSCSSRRSGGGGQIRCARCCYSPR